MFCTAARAVHPSNRPTLAVAKTWTYVLSADKTRVVSMVVGGFF